jgi:DNA-binding transcriptional LysR family regulator
MRYVTAVAKERSFSRAAEQLHIAQQALSQQVRAVEQMLGVVLFTRTNRGVTVTAAGEVFVQEARRTLNAADRATRRAQAAARGETGTLRIVYTLATVYETLPVLIDAVAAAQPELKVLPGETFGADIARVLADERFDIALAPRAEQAAGLDRLAIRREPFAVALATGHPLAGRSRLSLDELGAATFELWPREMAPGYYDAVVSACRQAGFEPEIDQQAAGSSVWGNIARGRGIGIVVTSARRQLAAGLTLVPLDPAPDVTIELVWPADRVSPALRRVLEIAAGVAADHAWL